MVQLSELAVFGTPGRYDLRAWQPEGTENAALNKMVSVSSDYVAPEGIWGSMLLNDGYIRGVVGYGGADKHQVMEMTRRILKMRTQALTLA